MRGNLFKYLEMIELFDYLKTKIDYWAKGNYRDLWNQVFTDLNHSLASGIQVTQACNCAILNKGRSRSAEPRKSAFRQIQEQYGCLFRHLRITDNLKLVVFLDTPFDNRRFHQVCFWDKRLRSLYPQVKVISITHLSPQNNGIYKHLGDWCKMVTNRKTENAKRLFDIAKETVAELS